MTEAAVGGIPGGVAGGVPGGVPGACAAAAAERVKPRTRAAAPRVNLRIAYSLRTGFQTSPAIYPLAGVVG